MSDQFRTFQNVRAYEDALRRHAQYVRWMQSDLCACINEDTLQPDPQCAICKGRGFVYVAPGVQFVLQEIAKHDVSGRIYVKNAPVADYSLVSVFHQTTELVVSGTQPADGSYVQVDPPYPFGFSRVRINYPFRSTVSVADEDSLVTDINTLRTTSSRFVEKGKAFEGSLTSVSRVYNVTKAETYTVGRFEKEYIYLVSMGTYAGGDVLEVDYEYLRPFSFALTGVSPKMRYEQTWVMEQAEALLIVPYYVKVGRGDVFTMLAGENIETTVVDPSAYAGNDELAAFFDISKILSIRYKDGSEADTADYSLFGRNEIKWNVSKPTEAYSVRFMYHPTFTALVDGPNIRNAENKSFVNRVNLVRYQRTSTEVVF